MGTLWAQSPRESLPSNLPARNEGPGPIARRHRWRALVSTTASSDTSLPPPERDPRTRRETTTRDVKVPGRIASTARRLDLHLPIHWPWPRAGRTCRRSRPAHRSGRLPDHQAPAGATEDLEVEEPERPAATACPTNVPRSPTHRRHHQINAGGSGLTPNVLETIIRAHLAARRSIGSAEVHDASVALVHGSRNRWVESLSLWESGFPTPSRRLYCTVGKFQFTKCVANVAK